ncbi:MAG: hypothetical protein RMY00_29185 [Nostoc sp. ChiVER01]|nr:hypothetical protein [Nostoc sp. ChiVER01]MDZ8227022.1 hypothetical protein [Nostoc sp. ChiVER01]
MLYRHNPELLNKVKIGCFLVMRSPTQSVENSMYQENRFKMLTKSKPEVAKHLLEQA